MDFKEIIYTKADGVGTITLNRPQALNALTFVMIDEWVAAIEDAKRDKDVKVLVVTGAGRGFCAGADVKAMNRQDERSLTLLDQGVAEQMTLGRFGIQRIPRALKGLDKPYIAAVNGPAAGGGMDLASMADIRIVSDRAKFGMTQVKMVGLSQDGGYYFLVRIVGIPRALELCWTCRMFDAQEALQIGYALRVVPHDELMATTRDFAIQLAKGPSVAQQLVKRLIYRAHESTLEQALEDVEWGMVIAQNCEDAREGPLAWAEKRAPHFKGR